jgi:TctA family transporter
VAKFAIFFICTIGGIGLLMTASVEYQIATIAILVVLAIFDAFANEQQKRRTLELAKNSVPQILRPPLSFVLWLCNVARDVSPIQTIKPLDELSRAELKKRWADSWMTAPARYFRSRIGGK